jgi:hypothetical protein
LAAGKVKVQVVIPKKQGHDFLDEMNTVVFKVMVFMFILVSLVF